MSKHDQEAPPSPFVDFARDFFETFHITVTWLEGRLYAVLDEALTAHFGQDQLVLAFTPHDPEGELVAYGSRLFEEMLAYIGARGRWTARALPVLAPEPERPRLVNGQCELMAEAEAPRSYFVFNFQLAFLSDERVERLTRFCLDEAGHDAPWVLASLEAARGGDAAPESSFPPADTVAVAERRALAEAEGWARPLEEAALERLRGLAGRLVEYYEAMILEVPLKRKRGQNEDAALDEAEQTRALLRHDLSRKLHDETARHQMRVQVRHVSQAQVLAPGLSRTWRLRTPMAARGLTLWHDLHTGECAWPRCERCGADTATYGLCADSHLTCPACLGACGRCDTDRCLSELSVCLQCGSDACQSCRETCPAGHTVCRIHLSACSRCGQVECPVCGPHAHGEAG